MINGKGKEITNVGIRFLHWNIGHYSKGNSTASGVSSADYEQKKAEFIEVFERFNADIVGLCEYSSNFYADKKASDEILYMYKYHYVAPTETGYRGNAIHAKSAFKLTSLQELGFGDLGGYEGILTIDGKDIYIVDVHLPWSNVSAHTSAISTLISRYADKKHVILGGDFNFYSQIGVDEMGGTLYKNEVAQFMGAGFMPANCGKWGDLLTSYNNRRNTNFLDNIFVKGGFVRKVDVLQNTPVGKDADNPVLADEELWDAVNLSDHFPIVADIEFEI